MAFVSMFNTMYLRHNTIYATISNNLISIKCVHEITIWLVFPPTDNRWSFKF